MSTYEITPYVYEEGVQILRSPPPLLCPNVPHFRNRLAPPSIRIFMPLETLNRCRKNKETAKTLKCKFRSTVTVKKSKTRHRNRQNFNCIFLRNFEAALLFSPIATVAGRFFYNSDVRRRCRVVVLCFNECLKFHLFVLFRFSAFHCFLSFLNLFLSNSHSVSARSCLFRWPVGQVLLRLALRDINGCKIVRRQPTSLPPSQP